VKASKVETRRRGSQALVTADQRDREQRLRLASRFRGWSRRPGANPCRHNGYGLARRRPAGDGPVQRPPPSRGTRMPGPERHAGPEAGVAPSPPQDREPVKIIIWPMALGGDLEDPLGRARPQRPRRPREPGEFDRQRGGTGDRIGVNLDRRAQGIATLAQDAGPRGAGTSPRNHLVSWARPPRFHDQGMRECGPTPYWTPTSSHRGGGRLAVDAASDDPPTETGDEDDRGREMGLGNLVVVETGGDGGVEEDEVGGDLRSAGDRARAKEPRRRPAGKPRSRSSRRRWSPTPSRSVSISL